jgi:hypothetical protein
MGLGFSFRIAPGVRIRASSRGIRTSIGPRAARVHVGSGGLGFSTGAGPVSFYTSLGGGGRSRRPRASVASQQRQLATAQRQYAAQQREAEARHLAAILDRLLNLHRQAFPAATAPVAPEPAAPDGAAIRRRHRAAHLQGVGFWQFRARAQAKARADAAAGAELRAHLAQLADQRARWQLSLNEWWASLHRNDADTVIDTLERVFEDNEAPAAAVGVDGSLVSLVVLAPGADLIPERIPSTTPTGRLSFRKLTGTERAALYRTLLCAHVLLTVREAFATAPGLTAARVAVVRRSTMGVDCLLAVQLARVDLDRIDWQSADADRIVDHAGTDLRINQRGRTRDLQPLDVRADPDLAAMLRAIDLQELQPAHQTTA